MNNTQQCREDIAWLATKVDKPEFNKFMGVLKTISTDTEAGTKAAKFLLELCNTQDEIKLDTMVSIGQLCYVSSVMLMINSMERAPDFVRVPDEFVKAAMAMVALSMVRSVDELPAGVQLMHMLKEADVKD